MFDWL